MVHDIVVVGGGVAGAAFAAMTARERDVVLVEREAAPRDKVCGEFLSGEAIHYLAALGVDLPALGAVPISTVTLSRGWTSSSRPLPFPAMSLSRRRLDEELLRRARDAGATVHRGASVRALAREVGRWRVDLDDGRTLFARVAVLASGKHDLRGWARPIGRQNDLIGLKRHFEPAPHIAERLSGTVELGLFPGGYAGLEPIEGGRANLCLLIRERAFAALGRDWRRLLEAISAATPPLGALLDGSDDLVGRPLAIARLPYGLVRKRSQDGLWRLGDQAAVIPSLSGEGISIALHSASLAAAVMRSGGTADLFQQRLAADVRRQIRVATLLSQALVLPATQACATATARLFPSLLSMLATTTRLTPRAITAAGIRFGPAGRPEIFNA
ncbi:NAD(P)/FAD-dependent oxidoreductase [Methylopila sp. Yamaguchi]|uniref:NAD(P)/FAD-dependent oxidoreductase n=1 Tax=Methylopila sp. Yamaguchi TaxID=1437817 RepID=UPI00190EC526|nr:lycopene cyclase family protein [Methylopila sp. Yamaguchi]